MSTKKQNIDKAFSLVETLIVIAVLGVLLSVISINMGGVKEKARINKAFQFAQSTQSSLGSGMLGYWSFENGAANVFANLSTPIINATANGAIILDGIVGSGLSFDGVDDYVDFDSSFFTSMPEQMTISLWARPTDSNISSDQIILHHTENGEFMVGFNSDREFFFSYNGQSSGWVTLNSPSLTINRWYNLQLNWDTIGNTTDFFVDGSLVSTSNPGEQLVNNDTKVPFVGARNTGAPTEFFMGEIDEIKAFTWD